MADIQNEGRFTIVKRGGYQKEEVDRELDAITIAAQKEKETLLGRIKEKEAEIEALKKTLSEQEADNLKLRRNINEKYQSYIDHYDTISETILNSKIQAKKVIEEAYAEKDRILGSAQAEIEKVKKAAREETIAEALKEKAQIEGQIEEKRMEYEQIYAAVSVLIADMDSAQAGFDEMMRKLRRITEGAGSSEPEESDAKEPEDVLEPAADAKEQIDVSAAEQESEMAGLDLAFAAQESDASPADTEELLFGEPLDEEDDLDTPDALEVEFSRIM